VRPGDEAWDTARQAWNLTVDQQPAMVAEVADAFDVQAVVRFAAQQGLRVAPQSTGHNAAPLGDLGDAVLLRTGRMNQVEVDADNEPDLFWAVRGGAANVGVVCALELAVLPIPTVYAGALLFPIERAGAVLAAYEVWTRDLDEAVTTCVRLLRVPPLPDIPEP